MSFRIVFSKYKCKSMKSIISFTFSCLFLFNLYAQNFSPLTWVTDLDLAIKYPEKVYRLDLSNQGLLEVPSKIKQLPKLRELKLSDNKITSLEGAFSGLRYLEFVELSGNLLQDIDYQVFESCKHRLQELYIRDNLLHTIDSSINILSGLQELHIGNNKIHSLPDKLNLPNLVVLYIDNNVISTLQSCLKFLPNLRRLNANNNQITSLDFTIYGWSLIRLDIGDNPLSSLNLSEKMKLEKLILDWVDLSAIELEVLPPRILRLSMEHCNLSAIPKEVFQLKYLKEYSIMHNQLETIPEQVFQFRYLEKLWIAGNNLEYSKLRQMDKRRKLQVILENDRVLDFN